MKISKKQPNVETKIDPYKKAADYLEAAIDELSKLADTSDDNSVVEISKDSIVDLTTVLLTLRG